MTIQDEFPKVESANDFGQTCPWCGGALNDRTTVDADRRMLFYRVHFECPACSYFLCTRLENFNVLGPVPQEGEPVPAYLTEANQRITLDLTQMIVRQLMPGGVESYEAGKVWTSEKGTVTKTWSKFSMRGIHLCLAILAQS